MTITFDQIQWKQVAHVSYVTDNETISSNNFVYKAEYGDYFLYKNGRNFQIEKKGTNQTKWLSKDRFIEQLNQLK